MQQFWSFSVKFCAFPWTTFLPINFWIACGGREFLLSDSIKRLLISFLRLQTRNSNSTLSESLYFTFRNEDIWLPIRDRFYKLSCPDNILLKIDLHSLGILSKRFGPHESIMRWLLDGGPSLIRLYKPSHRRSVTQFRVYFRRITLGFHLLSFAFFFFSAFILITAEGQSSRDSSRLYETLLSGYNKLVRPVNNNTDKVTVQFKLKLSQILDVVGFFIIMINLINL